jgi:hypothetical protein
LQSWSGAAGVSFEAAMTAKLIFYSVLETVT